MPSNPIDPLPRAESTAVANLVFNGKFLQPATSRSGVYRVAREMLQALDVLLSKNATLASALMCRVIVPGDGQGTELHLSHIRVQSDGRSREGGSFLDRVRGALWEQWTLPQLAKGGTLINLCNIGPVGYREAFTMVHDAQVYSAPDSYARSFRIWYRQVLPRLGRRNRALLTVSEFSRQQLARYGVAAAERICVIHDGCDHVLRLVPDSAKVEAAGLAGERYVLALANSQPHKNIPVLLKAFHAPALRDAKLALFGPAKREDFEQQGHTVPPNVTFLGFISDEELAGLLRQAAALAFPSTTEGFGLPPLEAMLLGCPAIVAPCGALPEVCGDAALWADAHDPAQWVRQIDRLYKEDGLREEMMRRGRTQAAQFTWDRAARRLLEIVTGQVLVDAGPPPTAHAPSAARLATVAEAATFGASP